MLFDGTCNLCDRSLQFILDHEADAELKFCALQSDAGREVLATVASPAEVERLVTGTKGTGDPDTVVLVEDGRLYAHSSAALRIMSHLRWPWRWGRVFVVVPRPLRDVVYRWIARNRYRWFGKAESCRVPTPELRARFL